MALKASLVVLSLLSLSLLLAVASAKQDPELKQCRHQCKVQQQFSEEQQRQCEQQCEDYHRQKQERERREREGGQEGGGQWAVEDDRKQLRECQKQCERRQQTGRSRERCQQRCVETYGRKGEDQSWERRGKEEEERARKWVSERYEGEEEEEEEQERGGREESDNPYFFDREHFETIVETEHGRFSVLPKFTKRSKLLRGIENFRFGFLEVEPNTFVAPSHCDADDVLFIVKGRGTITLVRENKRHSINVEEGDIVRVEAGTPVYIINRDQNQKFVVAKLLQPVNLPGHFEAFHGAGGQDPESFYRAFSWEVLEAALRTDRNKLERLFGQQQQGAIVKASREQIEGMSAHEEGGRWPFGGETHGSKGSRSFNLFNKRPFHANQHGQLYVADRHDLRGLEDMDVMVSFANITQGSMIGPYFNSRATKISFVTEGEGYFEMACPHLRSSFSTDQHQRGGGQSSRRQQQQGGSSQAQTYGKVRARLRRGTVFIVPAGHPVATIASKNNNLQILCFEVNAENNVRYPLAGKRNIIDLMEREAKELAFNFPSRDVERIFKSQEEEFFFAGPEKRQEEGRGYADE